MAATTLSTPAAGTAARRWFGLIALLTAEGMNLLDATIVQVAAPAIHADLGGNRGDIQWFTAAYTLPFAVLLVAGGRLGDLAGRRRVFRIGVTLFLVASLACALAPVVGVLIGCRAVQGAAAALVIPQTIGLIKAMFTGADVAKALGTIGPVMGLAGVAGPLVGGVLTHADLFGSSWRAVFLVNVPLGVAVLALTPLVREDRAAVRVGFDLPGTAVLSLAATAVVYPLIDTGSSRPPWFIVTSLAVGAVLLVGFALQQRAGARRGGRTLIAPSLFTSRAFPAALVVSTFFFAVMNGLLFVVVVQLQVGVGVDTLDAGLSVLPWSVGLGVASYVAGSRLVPRFGDRTMTAGLAVLLAGVGAAIIAYSAAGDGYPVWLLPALGLCGLGIGMFTPAFFTSTLHRVAPHEVGSAAGLLNAVQQFGATVGVAVLGTVYFGHASHTGTAGAAVAFGTAGVLLLVTLGTSRLMSAPD